MALSSSPRATSGSDADHGAGASKSAQRRQSFLSNFLHPEPQTAPRSAVSSSIKSNQAMVGNFPAEGQILLPSAKKDERIDTHESSPFYSVRQFTLEADEQQSGPGKETVFRETQNADLSRSNRTPNGSQIAVPAETKQQPRQRVGS